MQRNTFPYMTQRPITLGSVIRELRKARGWSQDDVAGRVGVKLLAYGKWERDQANPTDDNLVSLARVFGIDPTELSYEPPIWVPATAPEWAVRHHEEIMAALKQQRDQIRQLLRSGRAS